jgi:asparagine synthase (glutamine-hydrolysing)
MCGIAGVVALGGGIAEHAIVERMSAVIAHRGPDEAGTYLSGPVGLGFRRLSILDLSPTGHQPMASEDGSAIVVFNGEIYNFVELRRELETLGRKFRSSGDTEVLLQAYSEWGTRCLHKLNGMWAFLIYDLKRRLVFGSRDRFGIKPLFRYRSETHVLFGSEIKAIRASGLYRGGANWSVVSSFLIDGRLDDRKDTFYTAIENVPPGSAFELQMDGTYREWRYWSLDALQSAEIRDPPDEFAKLFEDAVRLHLRSDVPVGVHLSGGLDSTSILCAADRIRRTEKDDARLMAFSFVSSEFDESRFIEDTVQQTRAQLIKLETTPGKLWNRLTEVLWFQDEPIHTMTALVGYELMALTRNHGIKVILNGQGADETIAGYPSYFRNYWHSLLRDGEFRSVWGEIDTYANTYGGDRRAMLAWQLYHLFRSQFPGLNRPSRLSQGRRRKRASENAWFSETLLEHLPQEMRAHGTASLDSALKRSIERSPLPLYLRVEDRNSMAHSIEARLPFLDYRLVSLLFSLPAKWKMRGHWNKYVLREAMRGRIPESVRNRVDKMGFPVPAREWFTSALYEPMMDTLASRGTRERGIYNVPAIRRDLERHRSGKIDVSEGLFNVTQFETWCNIK